MNHRVLLADDHTLVRAGLRRLIEETPGFTVVGEAAEAKTLLRQVQGLNPDLVICDISMGEVSGFEAIRAVRKINPRVLCAIISVHKSNDFLKAAIDAGASAYLLKDSAVEELDVALKALAEGGNYFSPDLHVAMARSNAAEAGAPKSLQILSNRQFELLKYIGHGLSTKEVAYQLGLSSKTVESHRSQLMKKLGIYDAAGLIRFAIKNGLACLDDV